MRKFNNRRKLLSKIMGSVDEKKLEEVLGSEEYKIYNALITAQGAIKLALVHSEVGISLNEVVLIGYGRIGKVLAKMLLGMNANLTIIETNKIERMNATSLGFKVLESYSFEKADIVFNTVENYDLSSTKGLVIDLSSTSKEKINANSLAEETATLKEVLYIKEEILLKEEILGGISNGH